MNNATLGERVRESLIRLQLGVIVALLILTALVWLPKYQVNQDLEQGLIQREVVPEQVDRYRRTLAQILGGAAVLAGLYFTYRRVEIAQEGQITERFTRAIEQLGDEQLAMRLGGIYALERIAWDSERDHWTVMEVLTAFVRENAQETEARIEQVAPDVQAALAVIGRRNAAYDPEGPALNLRGARAPGISFYRADFNGALLGEADFSGAALHGVDFRKAVLIEADFSGALLGKIDFSGALLYDADFNGASLGGNFSGARYSLKQLAEAEYIGEIKGLSDEELAELERLRQASDEDDQQPREEGDSQ